jgi:predicted PurR-regulated permease PerM
VCTVVLSLLSSALSFVATTVMVLLIAALLIKLLWEVSNRVEKRTD